MDTWQDSELAVVNSQKRARHYYEHGGKYMHSHSGLHRHPGLFAHGCAYVAGAREVRSDCRDLIQACRASV
jgi:hypothetical protein